MEFTRQDCLFMATDVQGRFAGLPPQQQSASLPNVRALHDWAGAARMTRWQVGMRWNDTGTYRDAMDHGDPNYRPLLSGENGERFFGKIWSTPHDNDFFIQAVRDRKARAIFAFGYYLDACVLNTLVMACDISLAAGTPVEPFIVSDCGLPLDNLEKHIGDLRRKVHLVTRDQLHVNLDMLRVTGLTPAVRPAPRTESAGATPR